MTSLSMLVKAILLPLGVAVLAKDDIYRPSDGVLSANSFEQWLLSQPPFSRLRVAPGIYNVSTLEDGVHGTLENLADLNSKFLDVPTFEKLRGRIMTARAIPELTAAASA